MAQAETWVAVYAPQQAAQVGDGQVTLAAQKSGIRRYFVLVTAVLSRRVELTSRATRTSRGRAACARTERCGSPRTCAPGSTARCARNHQPLQWERRTTAPQALEQIAQVVRDHDLRHTESRKGSVFGVGTTVWGLNVDGERHEIRLEGLPADRAPGLTELDQAIQLAVAMGVGPGTRAALSASACT
jgi:hypothetical protein